jgi:hypothetical protein
MSEVTMSMYGFSFKDSERALSGLSNFSTINNHIIHWTNHAKALRLILTN